MMASLRSACRAVSRPALRQRVASRWVRPGAVAAWRRAYSAEADAAPAPARVKTGPVGARDVEPAPLEEQSDLGPPLGASYEEAVAMFESSPELQQIEFEEVLSRFKTHPEVYDQLQRIEALHSDMLRAGPEWDALLKQIQYGRDEDDPTIDWDYVREIIPNEQLIRGYQDAAAKLSIGDVDVSHHVEGIESDVKELYEQYQKLEEEANTQLVQLQKEQKYMDDFVENLREVTVEDDLKNEPEIAKKIYEDLDANNWDIEPDDSPELITAESLGDREALLQDSAADDAQLSPPPPKNIEEASRID